MSDQWSGNAGVPMTPPMGGAAEGSFGVAPLPKEKNVWLVWLVWPILTLGIYTLVWYYKINRETNFNPRTNANPGVSLMAILFGWIIIVPPYVSVFNTGKRIAEAQRAAGLQPTCNPWIGFVLIFVLGLFSLYYQGEMNKIPQSYPGAAPEQPVPLRSA